MKRDVKLRMRGTYWWLTCEIRYWLPMKTEIFGPNCNVSRVRSRYFYPSFHSGKGAIIDFSQRLLVRPHLSWWTYCPFSSWKGVIVPSGSTGLSVFLAGPLMTVFFLLNHLQPSSVIALPWLLTLTRHSRVLDGFAVIGMMGMSTMEHQLIY
jgi:hypothetical protein